MHHVCTNIPQHSCTDKKEFQRRHLIQLSKFNFYSCNET